MVLRRLVWTHDGGEDEGAQASHPRLGRREVGDRSARLCHTVDSSYDFFDV